MRARLHLLLLLPLCLFASVIALVRLAWSIVFNPSRAWKISVAYDQLGNTAANGEPDETISSRAARARREKRRWGCILCGLLDALDTDHCERNLEKRFLWKQSTHQG